MATPSVITPIKRRDGLFSTRFAGGRAPLTPSPQTPRQQQIVLDNSESIHHGNLFPRFSRSISKTNVRDSPKSNIARHISNNSPRRLELGVSDWTLTGTGPSASTKATPSRSRNLKTVKTGKTKISYTSADRFIPSRTASEAITNTGVSKIEKKEHSRSKSQQPESVIAGAASASSAFDLGRRTSHDDEIDAALGLDGLNLDDDEDEKSYNKPSPKTAAYQSEIAKACDISLGQRILAFKPAAPESSRPIDLRSQYNRPLKPAAAAGTQFRRRVATTPERVLDAPGLVDDYYLNLLDWSSGNQVAIGLERSVYVWSAESGEVSSLLE